MTALAPSLGPRAVSLSAALHAAVVTALLLGSFLGPERWPEVAATAPHVPMILAVAPLGGEPQRPRVAQPRLASATRRPPSASGPLPSEPVAGGRAIQEAEAPVDPGPGAGLAGGCATGCVVSGGEPGPGDVTGGPAGVADGAPAVVSIVQGGVIRPPRKIHEVAPVFPDLALRSRAEGRVDIECRIDPTGRVVDASVVRGHPLLSAAALDAVRQWLYEPTLLNGVPVSVIMTVTVHFRLHR